MPFAHSKALVSDRQSFWGLLLERMLGKSQLSP